MNDKDTYNLRHNANFSTHIYKDVYWVPVSKVGETKYTNIEIKKMKFLQPFEIKKSIHTLYEAIQYLQNNMFSESVDNIIKKTTEFTIILHTKGEEVISKRCGCCASLCNLFYYILEDKYEEVGIISFVSKKLTGHAVLYIKNYNDYYIVDPMAYLNDNSEYACVETGNIQEFRKCKILTSAFIKCKDLISYMEYIQKYYYILYKSEILLYVCKGELVWEAYKNEEESDHIYLVIPKNKHRLLGEAPNGFKLSYKNSYVNLGSVIYDEK